MLALDKRYYLNADKTKVVPEGSAEAAFLLGVRGHLISEEDAEKLGLSGLKSADMAPVLARAERGLPHRVSLDVMQQYAATDAEPEVVSLDDPTRTPLEVVAARVQQQRMERQRTQEGDDAESDSEGTEGQGGTQSPEGTPDEADEENQGGREQPRRASRRG